MKEQPFTSVEHLKTQLGQGKRKTGPMGLRPNIFDESVSILAGYSVVDDVLDKCKRIGDSLKITMAKWGSHFDNLDEFKGDGSKQETNQTVIDLTDVPSAKSGNFLRSQPKSVSGKVSLKDYQLVGLNWPNLLFTHRLSGILADEMGQYACFL